MNTFPYCKTGIHCYCSRNRVWGAYGLFDGPKHLPRARRRRGCVDVDVGKPIGVPRLQLFALTAQKTAIWRDLHSSQNVHRADWLGRRRTSLRPRGLSHCQFETSCTSAPHDAAAPTVTGRARGWAVLAAELPVACRQRAEPVVTDGCAHPKERKVTAQSRRGGGTSFPQLGHGEHEKMSGDVVVLQCRVGSHGACMGSARAQREARGAIFKDVLESVARNVARNGTDFRGARSQQVGLHVCSISQHRDECRQR